MNAKTQAQPLPHAERLNQVLAHIEANRSCWRQSSWHCGTSHCFMGWAQILSGKEANTGKIERDCRSWLKLTPSEFSQLAYGGNRLEDLHKLVAEFTAAGYNRDGYNRAGYNRAGYDRDGYNRDGYNRAGYDRAGYNRAGYDRDGYDRDGYDRDGYDRDGYDRAGLNDQFEPFGEAVSP